MKTAPCPPASRVTVRCQPTLSSKTEASWGSAIRSTVVAAEVNEMTCVQLPLPVHETVCDTAPMTAANRCGPLP